jgi:hypothetical protein
MAVKVMALRRDDACGACGAALPAGSRAQWDATKRKVTCLPCIDALAEPAASEAPASGEAGAEQHRTEEPIAATEAPVAPVPPDEAASVPVPAKEAIQVPVPDVPDDPGPSEEPPPIDVGRPGKSARDEFERRQAKREARVEQKWGTGRVGKVAKKLSTDPQTTTAWAAGASGEERVAQVLADRLGDRAVVLHDRKVPGTRGNIDHIAIAPGGIWVIDAKKYQGKVERRDVGGWFKTDIRLYVGGRDRTKAVKGLDWQVAAVAKALGGEEAPIKAALSFVGAEWPIFFAKPLRIDDVWISWPKKLAELIGADGPLAPDDIDRIARTLATRLRAN